MCIRLRNAGKQVLLDTRLPVGHIGDAPIIWPDTADDLRRKVIEADRKEDEKSSN